MRQLSAGKDGLSFDEAERRLADVGPNRLPAPPKDGPLKRFFKHFHDVLIYILIAAAGILDAVLALGALKQRVVPGIANFGEIAADCHGLAVSAAPQAPRSDVALVICRGFAGTDAALVVRAG